VLKSRRGLLAAGLAVAVVGALGVASTMNAGAEETGAAEQAPVAVEATVDAPGEAGAEGAPSEERVTPPVVLPWGERPARIRKGRPGANSSTLRAQGFDAADADTSGTVQPRGRYGPKGRSSRSTYLRTEVTDIAPPPEPVAPPGGSTTTAADGKDKVTYLYNVGSQPAETDGIYTNVTISRPKLDRRDYHTLAELAVQSADSQQIVEVGWNVDRVVNGDDDPHLFVYHWVNREPSCYNACGFVQYSKNVLAGATLPYDVTKKFGIQYFDGAWWIAYDSEWIGYFPEELWTDEGVKFNRTGLVQVFGEVAATSDKPCTDMGNGQRSDRTSSALMASISYLNGPPVSMTMRTTSDYYPIAPLSARTFRYGGPGAC